MEKNNPYDSSVVLGVINDEFVAGLTGLVGYQLIYRDHIFFSSCALSLTLLCFGSSNF